MSKLEINNKDQLRPKLTLLNKLGYAATAGVLLFANTDKSIGDLFWSGSETKLISDQEIQPGFETWVIVPGLGVQSGSGIASTLESTLNHRTNLTYFSYSDNGADIDEMAKDIIRLHNNSNAPINFYAHSMGGSISLQILQKLNNEVPINNIIFDCSPYDTADAYNPATPIYSEVLPVYGGGFLSKIIFETANNTWLHKNNNLSGIAQVKDAVRISVTGSSPRLFTSQLGVLGDTNAAEYSKYISDKTRLIYLRPKDASADETVNVKAAIEKYKLTFGNKLRVVNVKNGKHASPTQRPSEYNSALWPYIIGQQEEPLQR